MAQHGSKPCCSSAEAFEWITQAEDASTTFESLADVGAFETLDVKLNAALTGTCKGDIGRRITLKAEEEAKQRRLIKGRQILWMIYQEYRANIEAGAL